MVTKVNDTDVVSNRTLKAFLMEEVPARLAGGVPKSPSTRT